MKTKISVILALFISICCHAAGIKMEKGHVAVPKVELKLTPNQNLTIRSFYTEIRPGYPSIILEPNQRKAIFDATGVVLERLEIIKVMDAELECTCETINIGVHVRDSEIEVPIYLISDFMVKNQTEAK
jgi:hypothetical protein